MTVVVACREIRVKHQTLLRMYNKESEDNKRLSMDREQLMWRLTQDPPSSVYQASTRSAPGTPSAARCGPVTHTETGFYQFDLDEFIHDDSASCV